MRRIAKKTAQTHINTGFDAIPYIKLLTGVEPVTSSLPMRCATSCATAAEPLINLPYILVSVNGLTKLSRLYFYIKLFHIIQTQTSKILSIGCSAVNSNSMIPEYHLKLLSLFPLFFRQCMGIPYQSSCRCVSKDYIIRWNYRRIKKGSRIHKASSSSIFIHASSKASSFKSIPA